jgi:copper chaperone CopZ
MNKQITLPISGMTCGGCVTAVENSLKKLDGVIEASVNLAPGQASVTYDSEKLSQADLNERVELAGYHVTTDLEIPLMGIHTGKGHSHE